MLEKIIFVSGDVGEEGIGLSDPDRDMLINEVSVIFHSAAILKMDASLKTAVNVNTIGTVRMLDMAAKMKKLEVFNNRLDIEFQVRYSVGNEVDLCAES